MYWQNDGLGGYVSSILASNVFNQAWSIMGANINNDNILDVIVQDSTAIHFVKMNANHTAPIINTWTVGTGFTAPNFVLPVDVNNDGSIDLVSVEKNHPSPVTVVPTANGISGYTVRIRLYLNDGVGNFMAQPLITCSERNGTPTIQYITGRPAAGNLDADPYPELVIGSFASPTTHTPSPVFVLDNVTGTLDGSCTALNEHGAIPGRLHPSGVSIKDMNGDQKMDVVVGNFKGASVAIFPGNGTLNGLLASTPINLSSAGSAINGIEVADLNNDGNPDIVAANADPISPSVELFFNKGGMSFVNQSLVADIARTPTSALTRIQYNHGTSPMDVRVRDVNGDNKPDIITANFNPTAVNPATPTSSFSVILQK